MLKRILCLCLFFFSFLNVKSQSPDYEMFRQNSILNASDSQKIFFRVENLNLFKNTEFFNGIAEGHTYIGYMLRPSFTYQPTDRTALQVGIHMLKYSGINGFSQTLPYFRFQYKIIPQVDLVMGNIYSTLNHKMIEPMYGFDRYLENNNENGIQFLGNFERYKGDLWMNWEKFIYYNDPHKEQFSVGHTSEILLTNPDKPLKISIPIQVLFVHKGGQDTQDTTNLITRCNAAAGLAFNYSIDHTFIKAVGAYGYYLYFKDISPTPNIDFEEGNGAYANAYLNTSIVNVTMGYWNGYKYFNPRGDRMFSNISGINPTYDIERIAAKGRFTEDKRSYILSKVFIHHDISDGIKLAAAFESYYDYRNNQYDFYYALYVLCNMNFFIHKVKYQH